MYCIAIFCTLRRAMRPNCCLRLCRAMVLSVLFMCCAGARYQQENLMKTYFVSTALASGIILSIASAHADQTSKQLDSVQVTGSRVSRSIDQSTSSVTVIDRDAIEKSRSIDVLDLLSRQVGIDMVRTGGSGSQNSLFMRGGNSNHALVLIDGIRVNSATQGLFDFAHLPLANIERIEIVRGPRASVWGSDAISGVIQIFTRAPQGVVAELRGGSYGRIGGDAGFGTEGEKSGFGIIAGIDDVQGFSSTNANNLWSFDPDNDGYRNEHVSLNAFTQLGSQMLKFSGIATQGDVEFDQGLTHADNHSWSGVLSGPISGRWSHNLSFGQSYEKLDTPAYVSTYGSQRSSIDWSNIIGLGGESQLVLGANWAEEEGYSNGYAGQEFKQTRSNAGVFAVLSGQWQSQHVELASRYDDNQQYGSQLTSSLGWSWQINADNRLRASWGQGFRAPNFNELYYPGFGGYYQGNPDLNPEQSDSFELGYVVALSKTVNAEFSAYKSKVDDLISFEGVNNQAININKADIEGAEAELNGTIGAWQWRSNATWTQAVNADTGQALLRRPKLKGFASLVYQFSNQANIGTELSAYSSRADFGTTLPGYGRIDLTASYPFSTSWRIEGRIENLLDRDYQLADGYNTPGQSFFIRLNYQTK